MKKYIFAALAICSLSTGTVKANPSIFVGDTPEFDNCTVLDGLGNTVFITTDPTDGAAAVQDIITPNHNYIFTCHGNISVNIPSHAAVYSGEDCEVSINNEARNVPYHAVVTPSGQVTLECSIKDYTP